MLYIKFQASEQSCSDKGFFNIYFHIFLFYAKNPGPTEAGPF